MWKLILQLLLGQRNGTACWQRQQLTETGRAEGDLQLGKTQPLHYPPSKDDSAAGTGHFNVTPGTQEPIAHTPALLPSGDAGLLWAPWAQVLFCLWNTRAAQCQHQSLPSPAASDFVGSLQWQKHPNIPECSLDWHSTQGWHSTPRSCTGWWISQTPRAWGSGHSSVQKCSCRPCRHSTGTQDMELDMPAYLTINSVLISLPGNTSRVGLVLFSLLSSSKF